ncbi:MAG: hypothetical protein J3K34DRAFT_524076 [Monoraphidium minutum]|nr:MAG: hypothetical protein J3K34DRAFT_524076 [Monoraphidium minutum]
MDSFLSFEQRPSGLQQQQHPYHPIESMDELLGLLPRHLLMSPTQADAGDGGPARGPRGEAPEAADAPPRRGADARMGSRSAAALLNLPPQRGGGKPAPAQPAVGGAGTDSDAGAAFWGPEGGARDLASDNTRHVLGYLTARGLAALSALPPQAEPGQLAGGEQRWATGPLPTTGGIALQGGLPPGLLLPPAASATMPLASLPGLAPPLLPALPQAPGARAPPMLPFADGAWPPPPLSCESGGHPLALSAPPGQLPLPLPLPPAGLPPGAQLGYGAPPASAAMAAAAMAAWNWAGGSGARAPPSLLPGAFDVQPPPHGLGSAAYQQAASAAALLRTASGGGGGLGGESGLSGGGGGGGCARGGGASAPALMPPAPAMSRNLWLGNVMVADADVLARTFRPFGPIDSVRVFAGRTYAFVNFQREEHAAAAKAALEMQVLPELTSAAPLLVRFQVPPESYARRGSAAAAQAAAAAGAAASGEPF